MRGLESPQQSMFSYVSLGRRVPQQHPLRAIRKLVGAALVQMHGALTVMYSRAGRPSIPPARLIRALLLQIFFSVRSERQLMEQLDYNLLFRWSVGLEVDDAVWDASSFAKNRDRLVDHEAGSSLLAAVIAQARANDRYPTKTSASSVPCAAGWAKPAPLAAERDQLVVAAVAAAVTQRLRLAAGDCCVCSSPQTDW